MADNTAEIGNVEVDADDLEAALGAAIDKGGNVNRSEGGYAISGEAAVCGDPFPDSDLRVAHINDVEGLSQRGLYADVQEYTNVEEVRAAIADAESNKVGYVADLVWEANEVEESATLSDVTVSCGHISHTEMERLEEDDAISFGRVDTDGNNVSVHVSVEEDAMAE